MPGGSSTPAALELQALLPSGGELSVSIEFDANGAAVETRWPLDNTQVKAALPAEWDVEERHRYRLGAGRLDTDDAQAAIEKIRKIFAKVVELSRVTYWFLTDDEGALGFEHVSGEPHQLIVSRSAQGPFPVPEDSEQGTGTLALMTAIHEADFTVGESYTDGRLTVALAEAASGDLLLTMSQIVTLYNESHPHTT
jgi:hypothetical protein